MWQRHDSSGAKTVCINIETFKDPWRGSTTGKFNEKALAADHRKGAATASVVGTAVTAGLNKVTHAMRQCINKSSGEPGTLRRC